MAPAIPTYETVRDEVSSEFEIVFQNKPAKFATIREVKDILSDHRVVELYDSLKPRTPGLSSRPQDEGTELPATAERFLDLIKRKMLYEFLAVLLYAGCKKSSVEAFVEKMVVGGQAKEQNKRDEKPYHLPQEKEDLDKLFGNHGDAKLFYNVQDLFCVIVIGSPDVVTIKAADKRTLPWHVDTTTPFLGSGSYGKVEKVIVSPYHLTKDESFTSFNPDEVSFARKSFTGAREAKKNFDQELKAIRKILGSYSQHDHINTSVAAIIQETSPPSFYLLMPLAEMDLERYLDKEQEMGMALKTSLLESATGLADGLRFLHNGIRDGEEKYTCYHLDLKPANVLIFKGRQLSSTTNASDHHTMVWKITDFGISRVKTMNILDQKQNNQFMVDLFESQIQQTGQEGASGTQNRRGIGAFLPPEASSRKPEMNDKSDIWSLGCIISVLFTYMAYGSRGVKEYDEARGGRNKFGVERFWESASFFQKSINRSVSMKHRELIRHALNRNDREAAALEPMLNFLDSRVLRIDQQKRCDAERIVEQLQETRRRYLEAQKASTGSQYVSKPFARNSTGRLSIISGLGKSKLPSNVKRWTLGTGLTADFDKCDTSPDGKFLVYWNAETIAIFNAEATRYDAGGHRDSEDRSKTNSRDLARRASADMAREPTLKPPTKRKPDEAREIWKAVDLTNTHLVAMTTADEGSYCYVFMLKGEIGLDTYCRVQLLNRTIRSLSTCIDQETLICLLSDSDERTTLWRAKIGWFEPPPVTQPTSNTTGKTSSSDVQSGRPELTDKKTFRLKWSAQEIIHIILHTYNVCYMVVQEHRKPLELAVIIQYLDVNMKARHDLALKRHNDTTALPFSDMISLYNSGKPEAIMVTYSDTIWHFKSQDTGSPLTVDRHQQIDGYRILKVAKCESTARTFALGGYAGNENVFLLEIGLRQTSVVPTVEKVAKLSGLPKSCYWLHLRIGHYEQGKLAVMAMAVRPEKEYCVYRVDV